MDIHWIYNRMHLLTITVATIELQIRKPYICKLHLVIKFHLSLCFIFREMPRVDDTKARNSG